MSDYQYRTKGEYCIRCEKDGMSPFSPTNNRFCNVCGFEEKFIEPQLDELPRQGFIFGYCSCCKEYEEVRTCTMRLMHYHNGILYPLHIRFSKPFKAELDVVLQLEQILPVESSQTSLSLSSLQEKQLPH